MTKHLYFLIIHYPLILYFNTFATHKLLARKFIDIITQNEQPNNEIT